MSVRNANIVFGETAEELGIRIGRALTKTFIHSPFVLFEPSEKTKKNTRV